MSKKMILVVCGSGINTSTIATDVILYELSSRKINDIEVNHIMLSEVDKFKYQKNVVMVFMTKIPEEYMELPVLRGLAFLIGKKKDKIELIDKILATF